MNDKTTARSVAVTAGVLAAAGVLWLGLLAFLVVVVPGYEQSFLVRQAHLPVPTQLALAAGRWAGNYWYVVPLFGLFVLPVVIVLSWLLRHRVRGSLPGWLWFGALLGIPVLLQLGIWWALLLP